MRQRIKVYESALKRNMSTLRTALLNPPSRRPKLVGTSKDFAKKGDVYTYAKHGFEATEYAPRISSTLPAIKKPAVRPL